MFFNNFGDKMLKVEKANKITQIKRRIFCWLMENFNKTPRLFRSWFSRKLHKPMIDKTASIAGTPIYIGKVKIGKYTFLNGEAYLEHVDIGSYCSIGRDLRIISGNHEMSEFSTYPFWAFNKKTPFSIYRSVGINEQDLVTESKHTYIDHDVWIGSYVGIIGGVHIGIGAVIGAGSIVTKDVPPYAVVAGCPARIIRYRFDEEKRKRLLESKWWEYDAEKLICEWENLNR